jgi:hypothetical protein
MCSRIRASVRNYGRGVVRVVSRWSCLLFSAYDGGYRIKIEIVCSIEISLLNQSASFGKMMVFFFSQDL